MRQLEDGLNQVAFSLYQENRRQYADVMARKKTIKAIQDTAYNIAKNEDGELIKELNGMLNKNTIQIIENDIKETKELLDRDASYEKKYDFLVYMKKYLEGKL